MTNIEKLKELNHEAARLGSSNYTGLPDNYNKLAVNLWRLRNAIENGLNPNAEYNE